MRFAAIAFFNLGRRPLRSALTAVGIAMAVACFVVMVGLSRGLESSWTGNLRARGTHLLALQKGTVDLLSTTIGAGVGDEIGRVEGVEGAVGALADLVTLENGAIATAEGWPVGSHLWGTLRLVAGRFPAAGESDVAVLGKLTAEALGKRPGDSLRLAGAAPVVVGVFTAGDVLGNSSVILPLPTLQALQGREGKVTGFHVRVREPGRPGQLAAVRARLETSFPRLSFLETDRVAEENQVLRLIRAVAWSVPAVACAIALVVVLNTLSMSVVERTRELGILSALGWSTGRIVGMILWEGFLLGLAGTLAGIVLGLEGARWVSRLPRVQGVLEPAIEGRLLVQVVAAGAVLGVAGSLFPAWRAARLDPVRALRHE